MRLILRGIYIGYILWESLIAWDDKYR